MKLTYFTIIFITLLHYTFELGPVNHNNGAIGLLSIARRNLEIYQNSNSNHNLPYVTIAFAQTIDGSIAPSTKSRMSISSDLSFQLLHSFRKYHDAVLVGINTLIIDTPRLNVRKTLPGVSLPSDSRQPRAIVIDTNLKIVDAIVDVVDLRLLKPIIITSISKDDERFIKAQTFISKYDGAILSVPKCRDGIDGCDLELAFIELKRLGIHSVLVEGGAKIIQSTLSKRLCNQVLVTIYPGFLGGYRVIPSELEKMIQLSNTRLAVVGGDIVVLGEILDDSSYNLNDKEKKSQTSSISFLRSSVEVISQVT